MPQEGPSLLDPLSEDPETEAAPPPQEIMRPAIRTMQGDTETLVQRARTITQLIGRGVQEVRTTPDEPSSRWLSILAVLIPLLVGGGFAGWWFYLKPRVIPPPPPPEERSATFFAVERTIALTIDTHAYETFGEKLIEEAKQSERAGTVKAIAVSISDGDKKHFMTPAEFFEFLHINPPEDILLPLEGPIMLFVSATPEGPRMGLSFKTRDPDRTIKDLVQWEGNLDDDLSILFLGKTASSSAPRFEDRTFRNIDWRWRTLSANEDFGVGHMVFPVGNTVVITTSRDAMETVIARLFDAR